MDSEQVYPQFHTLVLLDIESTFHMYCLLPTLKRATPHLPQPVGSKRNARRFRLGLLWLSYYILFHARSTSLSNTHVVSVLRDRSGVYNHAFIHTCANVFRRVHAFSHTRRFRLSANMQMGSAWFLAGPARNTLTSLTLPSVQSRVCVSLFDECQIS